MEEERCKFCLEERCNSSYIKNDILICDDQRKPAEEVEYCLIDIRDNAYREAYDKGYNAAIGEVEKNLEKENSNMYARFSLFYIKELLKRMRK